MLFTTIIVIRKDILPLSKPIPQLVRLVYHLNCGDNLRENLPSNIHMILVPIKISYLVNILYTVDTPIIILQQARQGEKFKKRISSPWIDSFSVFNTGAALNSLNVSWDSPLVW